MEEAQIFTSLNSYLGAPPKAGSFLFSPCGAAEQKCACFEMNTTESGRIKAHHNKNRGGKFPLKCRERTKGTCLRTSCGRRTKEREREVIQSLTWDSNSAMDIYNLNIKW